MFKKIAAGVKTELSLTKKGADPFSRLHVDIEDVLLNEEGRPVEEVYNEARTRFEKPGCCLIVKFDIDGEAADKDPMVKLGITMYLRSVMETCAVATDYSHAEDRAKLIKYDDDRAFLFHENANVALRSACKAHLVAKYCNEKFAKEKGVAITVTCGLEVGKLLLVVGDYYGNPVNIASKLGEDHAEPGQILISIPCHEVITEQDPELLKMLNVEDGFVKISGVEIPYKSISMDSAAVDAVLPKSQMPDSEALMSVNATLNPARHCCLHLLDEDPSEVEKAKARIQEKREVVTVLQSDMSGFTRLTKKYGILHFLTLVTHCREIFKECLPATGGTIIKYDGDNVIVKFDGPLNCLAAVRAIRAGVDKFNVGKEKDFQIRIKLGVSHGEVLIVGNDIVGESWEDCCTLGEDAAQVGEVLVTNEVYEALQNCGGEGLPKCNFESRQLEVEEGEILKHFNVTFAKENVSSRSVMEAPHSVPGTTDQTLSVLPTPISSV